MGTAHWCHEELTMTDLDCAPPSFTNSDCVKVIFVDFINAKYELKFDVAAQAATVFSEIEFVADDHGLPVIILNQPVRSAHLDGKGVRLARRKSPDGAACFRVLSKSVSPGKHVLTVESRIAKKGPYGCPVTWIESDRVECIFNMSDLDRSGFGRKGEFLGAFLPANYNYDHFRMSFSVTVRNTRVPHSVFSNGTVSRKSKNWQVEFPEFFTSSCPWFHLGPKDDYSCISNEAFPFSNGRRIPIRAYTKRKWLEDEELCLEEFVKSTQEFLNQLEESFGPFPHDSVTIFAEPGDKGGMEYAGATKTKLGSLRHELDHSYFARSVIPVNGNAAWIDEAIAMWGDKGYRSRDKLPLTGANMGRRSPYIRTTHSKAYSVGRQFLAHLDYVFKKKNKKRGLKVFLAQYARQKRFQSVSVSEFQTLLEGFHGESLQDLFERCVYSNTAKRGPRGAMIDWNAVFATLPGDFTLDTLSAHETASWKPRAYLRQLVVRWMKEGRVKRTGRGMYQKI